MFRRASAALCTMTVAAVASPPPSWPPPHRRPLLRQRRRPTTPASVLARMSTAQRARSAVHGRHPGHGLRTPPLPRDPPYHVGNVMLTGRSAPGGRGAARVTHALQPRDRSATAGVRLFVATDQEGGPSRCCTGPVLHASRPR